jgi:hypothetical protein
MENSSCELGDSQDSASFTEALQAGAQRAAIEELAAGKRHGRKWGLERAPGRYLRNLASLRERCEGSESGWWESSFEHVYRSEGGKRLCQRLACGMIGMPLDEDVADEFWEWVFPKENPYLHCLSYLRGFSEGALKAWASAEGRRAANRRRYNRIPAPRTIRSKFVLCLDQDPYSKVLHTRLRRDGWRVVHADWKNAIAKFASKACDLAIIDLGAYPPPVRSYSQMPEPLREHFKKFGPLDRGEPDPDRYGILKELSNSDWGRKHPVIVWADISEKTFHKRAAKKGLALSRLRFYCKGKLEIPPELECIRSEIIAQPGLLNIDFDPLIPTSITTEWIAQHPSPFVYVVGYFEKLYLNPGKSDSDEVLAEMPSGYRMLWLYWRCVSDVENGGFG